MKRIDKISKALRCTYSPGNNCIGNKCPYYATEVIPENELWDDSVRTCSSCDIDQIGNDAADILDALAELFLKWGGNDDGTEED